MGKRDGGRKKKYEGGRNKRYSNSVLSTASGEVFFIRVTHHLAASDHQSSSTGLPARKTSAIINKKIIIMKYNLSFALCSVRLVPFCNPLPSSCAFPAESQFYFLAFTFSLPLFLFKLALYFPLPRNFFLRRVFCAAFIRFPFFFPLTVLFMLPVFQLSYFILFCTTSLYILPPFAALCLYYSNQIPITSFYQRCQPSRRYYFHVMKLAYNPFKAVKPRLNINTPHY